MGVELQDAGKVASLLGTKVFVDEFISFMELGNMIKKGEIAVSCGCRENSNHSIQFKLFKPESKHASERHSEHAQDPRCFIGKPLECPVSPLQLKKLANYVETGGGYW